MEHTYDNTEYTFLLYALIFIISLFVVWAVYLKVVVPFMKAREYIKMEMQRSDGEEYYYWKNELKRLYISHIPVIDRFFK